MGLPLSEELICRYMRRAYLQAALSPDKATQNGAVIVCEVDGDWDLVASGCNTFPRDVQVTPERLQRPLKYQFIEHAERNAIFDAVCAGAYDATGLYGATMVCPYAACHECARAIIQAGISHLIADKRLMDRTPERWRESVEIGNQILDEAGVERHYVSYEIGGVEILFDGEVWRP